MPEKKRKFLRGRVHEHGAAMLETLLALFVLFLVLLGMLQVFYFMTGQLFTDYAAFRAARSGSVGFEDYIVSREARIAAIGASGRMIIPTLPNDFNGSDDAYGNNRFTREKTLIERYLVGVTWLEYENWFGTGEDATRFSVSSSDRSGMIRANTLFQDYAFHDEWTRNLFFGRGTDLRGDAGMSKNSSAYLEE